MRARLRGLALVFMVLTPALLHAQDGGAPGSPFRSFSNSAEASRGRLGGLLEPGVFSGLWNPAALGLLENGALGADAGFWAWSRQARTLAAAWPWMGKGGLALSWFAYGNGDELEARRGPSLEPDRRFSDSQNLFDLAGATKAGKGLWAGLGIKLYQQRLDESSGTGLGLDLGLLWEAGTKSRFAFSVRDLGGGMKLSGSERENFPPAWGLEARHVLPSLRLAAYGSLGGPWGRHWDAGLGLDFAAERRLRLSGGWSPGRLGLGAGFRFPRRGGALELDYALSSSPISFWKLGQALSLVLSFRGKHSL